MAARSTADARCVASAASVALSSAMRRAAWVLVSFSIGPPTTAASDRRIVSAPACASRSDHRSAHTSPRRAPVAAITRSIVPKSGSRSSAAARSARVSASGRRGDLGLAHLRRRRVGRRVRRQPSPSHGLRKRPPHHRMDLADARRCQPAPCRQLAVEGVELLRGEVAHPHPAERRQQPLVDQPPVLRAVDGERSAAACSYHDASRSATVCVVAVTFPPRPERLRPPAPVAPPASCRGTCGSAGAGRPVSRVARELDDQLPHPGPPRPQTSAHVAKSLVKILDGSWMAVSKFHS